MTSKPFARQLQRVRRLCLALPDTFEKISHGEPTFFTKRGVFAMFANNHHDDGHVAVWLPASAGQQDALIEEVPTTYFRPPYVGSSGWIGVELDQVGDDVLAAHIRHAWQLIVSKEKKKSRATR